MEYLVFVGAAVAFIGGISYVLETVKGTTKPNRVTWFLWAAAPMIATAAALMHGVSWAILPVFMAGFMPLLVFLASFLNREAYWELRSFDYWCGAVSVGALLLWILTANAVLAIVLAILADALAALPTVVKAWRFPETESVWIYLGALFSASTAFFAIERWSIAEFAFPLYLVVITSILSALVLKKYLRTT